jgi:probable F420-dependent oxidoreductase
LKFVCSLAFGDLTHYCELARTAEECGWDAVAVSDHVLHPEKIATPYPYTEDGSPRWAPSAPWPDPWVAIGAMAAVTRLRNPFSVAKAVGTAAVISAGRVDLGIGVGWMREEFELMEQRFERRGARTDEMIEVLRALWSGQMVEHHGEFYDFDRLQMSPGVPQRIPIYSGGISAPALRRVGRLTDGWISDLHTREEIAGYVAEIRRQRAACGRADAPLDIVAACRDAADPAGYRELEEIGVTHLLTMPWLLYGHTGDDLEAKRDGLRRFAGDVIERMR